MVARVMECPAFFIFETADPECPPFMRAVAALPMDGPGRHWMSYGATPEEASEKLRAFWAKTELGRPPKKPRKPKAGAIDGVSDDDFDVI